MFRSLREKEPRPDRSDLLSQGRPFGIEARIKSNGQCGSVELVEMRYGKEFTD